MNVASLQPGDIIEVNRKGRHFHAVFNRRLAVGACLAEGFSGELVITPLDARVTYRAATAREVVGIWRATKATRARSCMRNNSDFGGVAKNETTPARGSA